MNIEEQKNALAYILNNPPLFPMYRKSLRECHVLTNDFAKTILEMCDLSYNILGKKFPTTTELTTFIRVAYEDQGELITKEAVDFLTSVAEKNIGAYSALQLKEHIVKARIKNLVTNIDVSDSVPKLMDKLRAEMKILSTLSSDVGVGSSSFYTPLAMQEVENLFNHYNTMSNGIAVSTGISRLDNNLKGLGGRGLYPGDFCCFMSYTGGGKTTLTLNVALNMVREGYRVLYFVLDNERFELAERIYANLTQVKLSEDKEIHNYMTQVESSIIDFDSSNFLLKLLQPNKYTTADAMSYIELATQIYGKLDVVVFDSGDLLRPTYSGYKEKRHTLDGVYAELRGIANNEDYYLRCINTTQTNIKGLNAGIMSLEALSEAYAKSWHTSLFVALCHSLEDRITNTAKLAVLKNTRGLTNFLIPICINFDTMTVNEDMENPVTLINQTRQNTTRRQDYDSRQFRPT